MRRIDYPFVGRKAELQKLESHLCSVEGQAILVVGRRGMGKTVLLKRFADLARAHPTLKCGCIHHELAAVQSTETVLKTLMDDALESVRSELDPLALTTARRMMFLSLFKLVAGERIETIAELGQAFVYEPTSNINAQFVRSLEKLSNKLSNNTRAVFLIDPVNTMQPSSDESWGLLIRDLPPKIKFVFAQRPEDLLVHSLQFHDLMEQGTVVVVPDMEDGLGPLDAADVEELLEARINEIGVGADLVREPLHRYDGDPYAIQAAINLVGSGVSPDDLPPDPSPISKEQWKQACQKGRDTIALLQAYAILEVPVSDSISAHVSGLDGPSRQSVLADNFVSQLLKEVSDGNLIYHSLMASQIYDSMTESERNVYHERALEVYISCLQTDGLVDAFAARRLLIHAEAAGGAAAFVQHLLRSSFDPLRIVGEFGQLEELLNKALGIIEDGSAEKAEVLRNLGYIHRVRGRMAEAEEEFLSALHISELVDDIKGIGRAYRQLGVVERTRGQLDKAEETFSMALEICRSSNDEDGEAWLHNDIGLVRRIQGDMEGAEAKFENALKLYEKHKDAEGIARTKHNQGILYRINRKHELAETCLREALEMHTELGNRTGVGKAKVDLALLYRIKKEHDKALSLYGQALTIHEDIGSAEGMAQAHQGIAAVHTFKKEFDDSEKHLATALSLFENLERSDKIAAINIDWARVNRFRGRYEAAETMLNKALELNRGIGYREGEAIAVREMGLLRRETGDLDAAMRCFKESRALFSKGGFKGSAGAVHGRIKQLEKRIRREQNK